MAGATENQDTCSERTEEDSVQSSSDSNDEGPVEQHRGLVDFPSDLVINKIHYVKDTQPAGMREKARALLFQGFGDEWHSLFQVLRCVVEADPVCHTEK